MRKRYRTKQHMTDWNNEFVKDWWYSPHRGFFIFQRYRRYLTYDQPVMTKKEFIRSESVDRRYDAYRPLIDLQNNPLYDWSRKRWSPTADTALRTALIAARKEKT